MTDFLKIAKSIVVHFAHICAYGVETVKKVIFKEIIGWLLASSASLSLHFFICILKSSMVNFSLSG